MFFLDRVWRLHNTTLTSANFIEFPERSWEYYMKFGNQTILSYEWHYTKLSLFCRCEYKVSYEWPSINEKIWLSGQLSILSSTCCLNLTTKHVEQPQITKRHLRTYNPSCVYVLTFHNRNWEQFMKPVTWITSLLLWNVSGSFVI